MIDLQHYLQLLIQDKELRNSREVIKFLQLHKFCPEFLINPPCLLFHIKEKQNFQVSLVQFIP